MLVNPDSIGVGTGFALCMPNFQVQTECTSFEKCVECGWRGLEIFRVPSIHAPRPSPSSRTASEAPP